MTVAATGARRVPLRAPQPRPLNWEMIAALLAVLAQLGAAIWFASATDRRVAALEEQLPAGSIQRLDERTLQIQRSVERLEARR